MSIGMCYPRLQEGVNADPVRSESPTSRLISKMVIIPQTHPKREPGRSCDQLEGSWRMRRRPGVRVSIEHRVAEELDVVVTPRRTGEYGR